MLYKSGEGLCKPGMTAWNRAALPAVISMSEIGGKTGRSKIVLSNSPTLFTFLKILNGCLLKPLGILSSLCSPVSLASVLCSLLVSVLAQQAGEQLLQSD